MKQEQENHDNKNIVPLGNDEIKSILKSQSETIFEEKNISNNSNFVKKSLIDIALDFETKKNNRELGRLVPSFEHRHKKSWVAPQRTPVAPSCHPYRISASSCHNYLQ